MKIDDFNYSYESNHNTINATYTLTEKAVLLISENRNNLEKIKKTAYGPKVLEDLKDLKRQKTKPSIWWSFVWDAFTKLNLD